jgi:hypothetical protein
MTRTAVEPFKVLRWLTRRNTTGSVIGFVDVELPSGLRLLDLRFGLGPRGTYYVLPPAEMQRDRDGQPVLDERGKPRWYPRLAFRNERVRQHFQGRVIDALRTAHPEVFADEKTGAIP